MFIVNAIVCGVTTFTYIIYIHALKKINLLYVDIDVYGLVCHNWYILLLFALSTRILISLVAYNCKRIYTATKVNCSEMTDFYVANNKVQPIYTWENLHHNQCDSLDGKILHCEMLHATVSLKYLIR